MYAIVHFDFYRYSFGDEITDDQDFCYKLVQEENVFVLPGSSFGVPGTFRVAFSAKQNILEEACSRISRFCKKHARARVMDWNCFEMEWTITIIFLHIKYNTAYKFWLNNSDL